MRPRWHSAAQLCWAVEVPRYNDLTNKRFGRLFVVGLDEIVGDSKRAYWKCWCDCGQEKAIRADGLTSGAVQSCGCLGKEHRAAAAAVDFLIEITFTEMVEAGIVPPPPQEMQGMDLNVEFVSMLAQAQQAVSTNSIDRFVVNLGAIAQFKPDVLDKFDADKWADMYADMTGVDPDLIVPGEQVALIRKQRAEAQQAAQQSGCPISAGRSYFGRSSRLCREACCCRRGKTPAQRLGFLRRTAVLHSKR